ncbi:MAG: cytochrome c [Myxococcales bacterium]|nr:cytochrome c [Myxococcales bacterium]
MRWAWMLALAAGCSASVDDAQVADITALTADAVAGEAVYADLCERCHGPGGDGEGVDHGPALTGLSLDAEQIVRTVLGGPFSMPSFAEEPDQDLADVTAYVLTLAEE